MGLYGPPLPKGPVVLGPSDSAACERVFRELTRKKPVCSDEIQVGSEELEDDARLLLTKLAEVKGIGIRLLKGIYSVCVRKARSTIFFKGRRR